MPLRLSLLFFLTALLCVSQPAGATSDSEKPVWLHYPEAETEGLGQSRYFWTDIDLPEDFCDLTITFINDDHGYLILDGKRIADSASRPTETKKAPARLLENPEEFAGKPGRHRIEFWSSNTYGIGGVLCRVAYRTGDELVEHFSSSEEWLASKSPSHEGGEATAVRPAVHGSALSFAEFRFAYDVESCLPQAVVDRMHEEAAAEERRYAEILQEISEQDPESPESAVIYEKGRPSFRIGSETYPPILYSVHHHQNFVSEKYLKSLANFRDAGLHLYLMGIAVNKLWLGPGQYDFSSIDGWMRDALLNDPQARICFDIAGTRLPEWWMAAHPEECVEYLNTDYAVSSENPITARYVAPSYASEKYLFEYLDFLRALVSYIEAKPWARRIFAYRNDSGIYLEWHHWGMNGAIPDVSEPMQRYFAKFLKQKYGTDVALQTAWGQDDATLATARLATREERLATHAGDFRDNILDAKAADSVECVVAATADFLLATNHAIKEACRRRALVGNFYGYFFEMYYPAVGWHLQLERMLNSPDVDFHSQPPPYDATFRSFGEPQFSRGLVASYRLHGKLNIMEADTRANPAVYGDDFYTFAKTDDEVVQLLARDFSQALCQGNGFWYFDFGFGWYTAPQVREYLSRLRKIWEEPTDNSSVAEVLLVGDMSSVVLQAPDWTNLPQHFGLNQARGVMSHTGVPFDTVEYSDLAKMAKENALSQYRAVVFLNELRSTPERIAFAKELRASGKTIVWLDRAGMLRDGKGYDLSSMKELTGFKTKELRNRAEPFSMTGRDGWLREIFHGSRHSMRPFVYIADTEAKTLGRTQGKATFAVREDPAGGRSYLAIVPDLSVDDFREIFRTAGVHSYCAESRETVVCANRSHLMVHVKSAGARHLAFPRKVKRLVQLLPEEKILAEDVDAYTLEAADRTTYLLRMEE